MAKVELKNINKVYPNGVQAVFDFNLTVEEGEFVALVGPSGCGKSTTLRMIAGLEEITSGELIIGDKDCTNLPPVERDIAMVFQDYALYPQLTVYENVGISMRLNHEDKYKIHDAVKATSNKLELNSYLNRLPANLSGGQRQRVALGRTVIRNPKTFLMDEPLSNLDAKLREKTRGEIVSLQRDLGVATVYVTHDQIEAMTMADRMVVMKDGYIQQIDTPFVVYNSPVNLFVATFIGIPTMNLIEGKIEGEFFVSEGMKIKIPTGKINDLAKYNNKEVVLGCRPEHLSGDNLSLSNNKEAVVELEIDHTEFLGKYYEVSLKFQDQYLTSKVNANDLVAGAKKLKVAFELNKIHFFDKETTNRISDLKKGEV